MAWTRLEAPYLGIDTESSPYDIGRNYCSSLTNFLPGRPGKLPLRGPLENTIQHSNPSRTVDALWAVEETDRWLLAFGGGAPDTACTRVTGFGGVAADLVTTTQTRPAPFSQPARVTGRVYGPSKIGATGTGRVIHWDGTAAAPTAMANGPRDPAAVAWWLQRLWVLGGSDPTTGLNFNDANLYWSDPFDPAAGALADVVTSWQDDVSLLTNKILVNGISAYNPPVALVPVGGHLCALAERSIHMLRGSSPSTLSVRQEINGVGCLSAATVVPHDDGIFFLGPEGYYFYNGIELIEISKRVRMKFRGVRATAALRASAARLDREHIFVHWYDLGPPAASWAGILHIPTLSWSTFDANNAVYASSYAYAAGVPAYSNTARGEAVITNAARVHALSQITQVGTAATAVAEGDNAGGGRTAFTGEVITRSIRRGSPDRRGRLDTVSAEYLRQDASWSATPTLQVLDGHGTSLSGLYSSTHDAAKRYHRYTATPFLETDAASLDITMSSGTGAGATVFGVELHDTWVENDDAQRSPGFN